MTEPIKLPPLTVKMLMDVFGSHADIPPALLCTSWKDGIDIDETSMRAQMLVEAYARLAVEQNTAELLRELTTLHRWYADVSMRAEKAEAEVERLRFVLRGTVELAEFWINREDLRGISESEWKTWHALGHGSHAMAAARAALKEPK